MSEKSPNIAHPLPGQAMNDEPRVSPAPPAPLPLAGTLPGSSVPPAELEKAGADGLATKGVAATNVQSLPAKP